MKKLLIVISLVIVFGCIACTFVACAKNDHNKITTDYAKLNNIEESEVDFTCYGEFRGTHVVMFNEIALQVLTSETVDGVTFHYPTSAHLTAYKNGIFYSLQEAFDKGLLTHANLVTLNRNFSRG